MKKFLICLIFIINFHAHGETTWIECDIDDEWRKEGNENKLEADYQEYFVVNTILYQYLSTKHKFVTKSYKQK